MQKICDETNRYATEEWELEYEDGCKELWTKGGKQWMDLIVKEFQAFLVVNLIMGLKKMPNLRNYWSREPMLHCHVIPGLFSREQFMSISRCLHLTDPSTVCQD
jgi:hypothetical protein